MVRDQRRVVIVERDAQVLTRIFEHRVMSVPQIALGFFPATARQIVCRRLMKLQQYGFLESRVVSPTGANRFLVYSITPKALGIIRLRYPFRITKDLCKSDSVEHDLQLVEVRKRFQTLSAVTSYFTENMLQSCSDFADNELTAAFVKYNTDACLEVRKNGKLSSVGLEFERSEKTLDRYVKKLSSYYSDSRTTVVFYVCQSIAIRNTLCRAEASVVGIGPPRCFYALLEDVLESNGKCTFTNFKGNTITLE